VTFPDLSLRNTAGIPGEKAQNPNNWAQGLKPYPKTSPNT
jgi:hypothetical protein